MGRLLCPQTPLKTYFYAISKKSGKLAQASGAALWPSLFPLVGSGCIAVFGVYNGVIWEV